MKHLFPIITALLFAASFSFAQNTDEQWLQRSKEIMSNPQAYVTVPESQAADSGAEIESMQREAKLVSDISRESLLKAFLDQEKKPLEPVLLITFGSPVDTQSVRNLLESLSGEKVTLAVQGLPVGYTKIDQTALLMAELQKGISDPPGLVIDPRFFEKTQTTTAPTIVLQRDGEPLVWANGVSDPDWIMRRYKYGERGALGVYGTTEHVAEKNLKQEIAERIAKIDWEAKKDKAAKSFWKNHAYVELPTATKLQAFEFKLSYRIDKDMVDPDGNILARAGQEINPVSFISGSFYLVVFDASEPKQVALAKQIGASAPRGKQVKYLATKIDFSEDGWKEKVRLENKLNAPLFLLSAQQAKTLHLKRIPASVQTSENQIRVTEYPLQ